MIFAIQHIKKEQIVIVTAVNMNGQIIGNLSAQFDDANVIVQSDRTFINDSKDSTIEHLSLPTGLVTVKTIN